MLIHLIKSSVFFRTSVECRWRA